MISLSKKQKSILFGLLHALNAVLRSSCQSFANIHLQELSQRELIFVLWTKKSYNGINFLPTSHGIARVQNLNFRKTNSRSTVISRTFLPLQVGWTTNSYFRVYPRGNFWLMIFPFSTKKGRFTKFWFPNCAADSPCSKAGFSLYRTTPISIRS